MSSEEATGSFIPDTIVETTLGNDPNKPYRDTISTPGVDCQKFPTVGRKLKPKSTVSWGALRKVDS
eukprot:267723-Prorocentrum_minimum.AAC.1